MGTNSRFSLESRNAYNPRKITQSHRRERLENLIPKEKRIIMLTAFRLIPALQVIFSTDIEYVEDSFCELSPEAYAMYVRDHGESPERIFEIVAIERTAIERTKEKVTFELNVVSESQRRLLLEGVKFIYHCTKDVEFPPESSFLDRLEYLRKRLPAVMLRMPDSTQ